MEAHIQLSVTKIKVPIVILSRSSALSSPS